MSEILGNLNQVWNYLKEQGYSCSYKRLQAAESRNELTKRRGGGWTQAAALKFAQAYLSRRIVEGESMDRPILPEESEGGAADRKLNSQAELLEIQAKQAKLKYERERGMLTETATVEAELGERAKAFRLGLERFGLEQAEAVAGIFGGHLREATELARRIGLEGEAQDRAAAVIVDFALSRASAFPRFWAERIDAFLDPYSTGAWWTEDMENAWKKYQTQDEEPVTGEMEAGNVA